mgnify:CR=1 FL=1
MRHRVDKHHFNRDTKHRVVLIKNLVRALVEHGSITTTQAKAKEVKRHVEKLIGLAKNGSLTSKRELHRYFGKRDVVNTLVEKIAPLFPNRQSGFTTLVNLGKRRGDNAVLAQLSLIAQPENNKTLKAPADKKVTTPVKPKKITKTAATVKKTVAKKVVAKKASSTKATKQTKKAVTKKKAK